MGDARDPDIDRYGISDKPRTYLQTCPMIGALLPPTSRGGNDNDVVGAGEADAPAMGTASSSEW